MKKSPMKEEPLRRTVLAPKESHNQRENNAQENASCDGEENLHALSFNVQVAGEFSEVRDLWKKNKEDPEENEHYSYYEKEPSECGHVRPPAGSLSLHMSTHYINLFMNLLTQSLFLFQVSFGLAENAAAVLLKIEVLLSCQSSGFAPARPPVVVEKLDPGVVPNALADVPYQLVLLIRAYEKRRREDSDPFLLRLSCGSGKTQLVTPGAPGFELGHLHAEETLERIASVEETANPAIFNELLH
jgi:hypothetical protein